MINLDEILKKHNFDRNMLHLDDFIGEDIINIIRDCLVEFSLNYDFNPCTKRTEIEKCADKFCQNLKDVDN